METKPNWNSNEERVLKVLKASKKPIHLKDLAKKAFGARRMNKDKANSWARNGLRRPVKFHQVKKTDRGTYEFVGTKGGPRKSQRKASAAKRAAKPKTTEKIVTV